MYSQHILLSQLTKPWRAKEIYCHSDFSEKSLDQLEYVDWKVHRPTKIHSWNITSWGLSFNMSPPCSSHTYSTSVAVVGSHLSKKASTADMTSPYVLFSPPSYLEEPWRTEWTCCHTDISERQPIKTSVFAVLWHHRVKMKESKKIDKYLDLARELKT